MLYAILALAWIISVVVAYLLGYYLKNITYKVAAIEEVIRLKADKEPEKIEPVSSLIDPLDPVATAIYEREQEFKRLNPNG